MCDLILLRHGETAGQSSVRFYGSTDIGLSEFGQEQMRCAGEALRKMPFKTVIVSPLRRSRDSADIVLDGLLLPEYVVVDCFREIDFGAWEGLTADEIEKRDPENFNAWKKYGSLSRFPGGDSRAEFFSRVAETAQDVFSCAEYPVLAVLHKGVIKGILSALLGIPIEEITDRPIELGSIQRLSKSNDYPLQSCSVGWELVSMNDTGHLGNYRIDHS